ncbi:MAG: amidohydrolase family protein [Verrucomicrobiota bacterium]
MSEITPILPRRQFIAQAAAAMALALVLREAAGEPAAPAPGWIDCNAHLGPHPNRDLPPVTVESLSSRGFTEAWVAPLEALLHRDLASVNARHAARCGGPLRAVGVVHPGLPDWQEDLRRCTEEHGMKIIRLYPGYHGYALDDPSLVKLLEQAAAKNLPVQIVAEMENARTQHPLMQVKPVDFKPLAAVLKHLPELRVMVLNANATMAQTTLRGLDNVWLDIAMIEGVAGVENLLKQWPQDRLVFGSHAPFFYPESSMLKLQESELTEAEVAALKSANARAWLV